MFESPASHQVGLSFYYRGPEWAIAVRQGDMDALTWALERCSRFWNGANTLIVPVRSDGRTWPVVSDLLDVRPVERCFVHESVADSAQSRLAKRLGRARVAQWSTAWDDFDEWEVHPLRLQPPANDPLSRRSLRIPRFDTERLRRISLAAWGHLPDEHHPAYRDYFDVGVVAAPLPAHAAMLGGQLHGVSPLEQSVSLIKTYGRLPLGRSLFVFDKGSFSELVEFWNLRSRSRDIGNRPLLFGVAREALADPETLTALPRFLQADNLYAQKPDLGLMTGDQAGASQALESLGFEADTRNPVARIVGSGRGRGPLSFGFFGPAFRGPFKRGVLLRDQITIIAGKASFRPPRPEALPTDASQVRLAIDGLPLPLPLTDSTATGILAGAFRSTEGLTVSANAWIGQDYLQLELPDAWDALGGWADAWGETVTLSPPGSYGQALLDRLGDLGRLQALANEHSVAILSALTPISRRKLAQRVVAEAKKQTGVRLSEESLAELLAKQAHFLDLKARSASEIAGAAGVSKSKLLAALEGLVEAGFVARGAEVHCPRCRIGAVLLLHEQRERVRCHACRNEYLLPVLEEGKQVERPVVYRLDGLMARAMDQDLLPVLLTLRALLPDPSTIRAAWSGLEFSSSGGLVEHDLLASDGSTVWVAECKATASISSKQLRGLLDFADSHDAHPVLGALNGSFGDSQRQAVLEAGGSVFERAQLLKP